MKTLTDEMNGYSEVIGEEVFSENNLSEGLKGNYKMLQRSMKNAFDTDDKEEAIGNALWDIGEFLGDAKIKKRGDDILRTGKLSEEVMTEAKVPSKFKKALKDASEELGKTEEEVLKLWNDDKPHFGGGRPHRYDGGDDECSYCLRPKDWK